MTRHEESQTKHQRIVAYMDSHDLDAVVLTQRPNFAWYTAGGLNHVSTADSVGTAALLITRQKALCITNNIEAERIAEEELAGLGIEVRAAPWHDNAALAGLWSAGLSRLRAACDSPLPVLPGHVTRLGADFASLRWVMTAGEIERYRPLARETADAVETACRLAKPGITEFELASRIAEAALMKGIRSPVVLVAADDRVRRFRHPIPTGRNVTRYGMAVLGGERHGLIVSTTRLFSFGAVDPDLRRRHEAVCQVDAAMIAATRPGKPMADVLSVAKQVYCEEGFADEWTFHHQGGLTGYLGREIRVEPSTLAAIEAGQVFGWNPSISGTKSEDTILVGPERTEILSCTGQWPAITCRAEGCDWLRNDILEL